MRYSYEYKRKCVELYREGKWPETPDGIKDPENFRDMIRRWVRMEEANGPDVLRHKGQNKEWKPEERMELVSRVLAGASVESVAIDAGISDGMLYQWVRKYKNMGYNGLVDSRKGRPPKEPPLMPKKKVEPKELTESEREELIRLRAEVEYLKAESAAIKKLMALRREKEAARLKAKKQQRSGNSEKKDTD